MINVINLQGAIDSIKIILQFDRTNNIFDDSRV